MTAPGHDTFHPYSAPHALAVLAFLVITITCVLVGRRLRGTPGEAPWRVGLTIAAAMVWLVSLTLWAMPGTFDPAISLPLHLCDLAGLALPLALLPGWRWARALVWFWGIGLSSQAFVTPTLTQPVGSLLFLNFWSTHIAVVGGAIYLVLVERYRPKFRDFARTVVISLFWFALVLALNTATRWNYGYIGPTPPDQPPTVIDFLGPWPARVVPLALLGIAVMGITLVPWEIARAARSRWHGCPASAKREP